VDDIIADFDKESEQLGIVLQNLRRLCRRSDVSETDESKEEAESEPEANYVSEREEDEAGDESSEVRAGFIAK
jgi:hypothetical protein